MMPGFMWEDVADVAAAAINGLDRGRLAALVRQHPALRRSH
jgi:hypothetical protein